ncbi:MAG: ABC transporter permease [Staphylococcus sp.]|nr:ABC transporter permease [Staphylococcus sp.]
MKLRSSIRQTITEARANPGFTWLYIGGVAFAVAFTMIITIIYYIHLAPIYPEYQRDRTSYMNNIRLTMPNGNGMSSNAFSKRFIDTYMSTDSTLCDYFSVSGDEWWSNGDYIQPIDNSADFKVSSRYIDPNFFRLYSYDFLAGRPFNEAETASVIPNVVITDALANHVFGSVEKALGNEISMNYKRYKVIGIVRRGTPLAATSYGDIFLPYTLIADEDNTDDGPRSLHGILKVTLVFKNDEQREAIRDKMDDICRRISLADTTAGVTDIPTIDSHYTYVLGGATWKRRSTWEIIKPFIFIAIVLLLVPAINISGMIGGQMDRRIAEIGIRRSFGATRGELTRQVMFENFLLTVTGGFIGLILAWIIIFFSRQWLLDVITSSWSACDSSLSIDVSTEMLFAPAVFIITLLICLALNLLSAYIPVKLSLRRPIVSSINTKR